MEIQPLADPTSQRANGATANAQRSGLGLSTGLAKNIMLHVSILEDEVPCCKLHW